MIHKRELSDSMIESVSSLFYLLHCSAHDRLNTMTFRSFRNIPHGLHREQHGARHRLLALCLSTSRTDCISGHKPCTFERRALPQHIPHGLHQAPQSSKPPTCCFASAHPARITSATMDAERRCVYALPQHIPHGLHQQNRTDAMPQIHAICCELVDSFSDAAKAASALTIFPCSSTVKTTYIAIIDSLGRTKKVC